MKIQLNLVTYVDLVKLVNKSNIIFQSLKRKRLVSGKELKYFPYK